MIAYRFTARWKEELLCESEFGQLVLEMPLGEPAVLFPTGPRWNEIVVASHWAHGQRDEILAALQSWCSSNGIPLVVTDDALPTDPAHKP